MDITNNTTSAAELALRPGTDDTLLVDLNSLRAGRNTRDGSDRQRSSRNAQGRHTSDDLGRRRGARYMNGTRRGAMGQDWVNPARETPSSSQVNDDDDDSETEVCFICASPVVHNSVAPCNHRTCHICTLRMRALYKTKTCAHCRMAAETVIFTDESTKRFEDYNTSDFFRQDDVLGICYEKPDIFEDTVLLLRYNCPDSACDVACLGWPDLHRHVKAAHQKAMCDLCTRNKKVFTHEHELFTRETLRKHEKFGDDNPGAIDQSGFTGHPECGFCRQRFYGDDELYAHCRDRHERCHICDARNSGSSPRYFLDYNALEAHFRKDHFICPDRECLEKKFVVFGSEMDLKAHQLETHPNGLSKDVRKIDISSFDYRTPHEQTRSRRDGRGRGRDPNADAPTVTSAQPLRRDELAFQRALAVQSAQSVTARTFGGQLTPSVGPVASIQARQSTSPSTGGPQQNTPRSSLFAPIAQRPSSPLGPPTQQEQARQLRHGAVTERAANLLGNDATKMSVFRAEVSSYRSGHISARALIESFFTLFDTSPKELGKLINELAEIFEMPARRDGLVKSWADWKAINEDYPSLPGPSGTNSAPTSGSNISGARILKLKSSTAQSGRSAVSQQGRWTPAANGKTTPSVQFPALSSTAHTKGNSKPGTASSGSASSGAASWKPGVTPAAPNNPSSNPKQPFPTGDLFPALPAAQKPQRTIFSPGFRGQAVRRPNAPTSDSNYWSANKGVPAGGSGTSTPTDVDSDGQAAVAGTSKKGNKGKKQVLYAWG